MKIIITENQYSMIRRYEMIENGFDYVMDRISTNYAKRLREGSKPVSMESFVDLICNSSALFVIPRLGEDIPDDKIQEFITDMESFIKNKFGDDIRFEYTNITYENYNY